MFHKKHYITSFSHTTLLNRQYFVYPFLKNCFVKRPLESAVFCNLKYTLCILILLFDIEFYEHYLYHLKLSNLLVFFGIIDANNSKTLNIAVSCRAVFAQYYIAAVSLVRFRTALTRIEICTKTPQPTFQL